jgi:hypothetical protein
MLSLIQSRHVARVPLYYYVELWHSGHINFAIADQTGISTHYTSILKLAKDIKERKKSTIYRGYNPVLLNLIPPNSLKMDTLLTRRPFSRSEYIDLHKALGQNIELRVVE